MVKCRLTRIVPTDNCGWFWLGFTIGLWAMAIFVVVEGQWLNHSR
jgi:hypothetical protein